MLLSVGLGVLTVGAIILAQLLPEAQGLAVGAVCEIIAGCLVLTYLGFVIHWNEN
jgi:hypothetical protein